MKSCLAGLLVTISLLAQTPGASADESVIRALVAKYVDARDRSDPRAIETLFTSDADQLVSSGEWRKGRSEVVRGTLASSQSMSGKRTITIESIRFVTPAVALADGKYEIASTTGESRKMWTTLVVARSPEGWRIAAIRNMLPAPSR